MDSLAKNLPLLIGSLAGITIGIAQITYIVNIIQGKLRPSVLTWLGWAFLMGTSLLSQIWAHGWEWSMTGILCSAMGCVVIAIVALLMRHFTFHLRHFIFLVAGIACLGVYRISDDPWITTIFAIIADALLAIPTVAAAIRNPQSERSFAWVWGSISSTLALSICFGHSWLFALFPIYLWVFNVGMVVLTRLRG